MPRSGRDLEHGLKAAEIIQIDIRITIEVERPATGERRPRAGPGQTERPVAKSSRLMTASSFQSPRSARIPWSVEQSVGLVQ